MCMTSVHLFIEILPMEIVCARDVTDERPFVIAIRFSWIHPSSIKYLCELITFRNPTIIPKICERESDQSCWALLERVWNRWCLLNYCSRVFFFGCMFVDVILVDFQFENIIMYRRYDIIAEQGLSDSIKYKVIFMKVSVDVIILYYMSWSVKLENLTRFNCWLSNLLYNIWK